MEGFFLLSLPLLILGLVLVGFVAERTVKSAPLWLQKVATAAWIGYAVLFLGFLSLFALGAKAVPIIVIGAVSMCVGLLVLAGWIVAAPRDSVRWYWRGGLLVLLVPLIGLGGMTGWGIIESLDHIRHPSARAKVARAKSEIRNLAVALETYYIKNESYPPAVDGEGKIVPFSEDGDDVSSGYVPWLLTTPVAHVSSIPDDPFGPKGKDIPYWTKTYRYAAKAKEYWIMTSVGPDLDPDMILEDYIRSASGDISLYLTQFGVGVAVEYDPTNGLGSSGDVFRTGP